MLSFYWIRRNITFQTLLLIIMGSKSRCNRSPIHCCIVCSTMLIAAVPVIDDLLSHTHFGSKWERQSFPVGMCIGIASLCADVMQSCTSLHQKHYIR